MQPFRYQDFVGLFNGEIYNATELVQKHGLRVESRCDTEVILPLYSKLGSEILQELDGFYSGVIVNTRTDEVFTLRDFVGKKPLLVGKSSEALFITSELKAIQRVGDFSIAPLGLARLVHHRPYFEQISAHKLVQEQGNIRHLLEAAVIKRIPGDGRKFGVFLSGGLDSSIVASVVRRFSSDAVFFSLGHSNGLDVQHARVVQEHLGIFDLHIVEIPIESEIDDLIDKVVYHTESYNPSIISNGLATFLLSRAAREYGLKVVLTGEGADEVFCGYHSFSEEEDWKGAREELLRNLHFTELRRVDLASMAHSVEIRCPFLDKRVVEHAERLEYKDFYGDRMEELQRKTILRKAFSDDLPESIVMRSKTSFDVGSGVRGLLIEHLTRGGLTEREALKKRWENIFGPQLAKHPWFHSYPTFDHLIEKRSAFHK